MGHWVENEGHFMHEGEQPKDYRAMRPAQMWFCENVKGIVGDEGIVARKEQQMSSSQKLSTGFVNLRNDLMQFEGWRS